MASMSGCPVDSPEFDLVAWVEASCAAQGLAVKVVDPEAVRKVGVLFGTMEGAGRPERSRGGGASAPLELPDRANPFRIKRPRSGRAGLDDSVIEHGGDHGVAAREAQGVPLVAESFTVADKAS